MNIGILTLFHENNNWGGNLQGYALKSYIEENFENANVDLINYKSGVNVVYKNKFEQMSQYEPMEILKKIPERVIKKKTPVDDRLKTRKDLFKRFQLEYLTNNHVYRDEDLQDLANEYDCLICGSDQIWNPNVARPGFFLKGVTGVKKVAYAASIARDTLSKKEATAMIPLIKQFDYVSVREKTAKITLDGYFKNKKNIYEVLDPALMRTKEQWSEFTGKGKRETKAYALMFFFSDSLKYRKYIESYCIRHNLKLIGIPHASTYIKNDEIGGYKKAYDVGPIEFLKLFRDASYVFTDSFHGSVFSIIFQKQFCVFERDKNTKISKNSRLYDLLSKFQLSDRLIKNVADIKSVLNNKIDYEKVNYILERERKTSAEFLAKALNSVKEEKQRTPITVEELKKKECCGCGLCTQICPKKCIELKPDNEGYFYPAVDKSKCIKCGLCIQKCVQKSNKEKRPISKNTYIGYNSTEPIRKESSSGGIFYAIASTFIENGGIVYGAAFDNEHSVKHIRVANKAELSAIMRSKYVQSSLKNVLEKVIYDLKQGKQVLFSGTPCQTAAVCKLAETIKSEANLYTVDFICHGVPSPAIWKSYLEYVSCGKKVHEVNFRDKSHGGWHDYYLHIKYGDNSQLNESHEINPYMQLFLSDKNIRSSCYYCNFKADGYMSDLTLADAWKIEKEYQPWADDKGTSVFFVRSNKGRDLINFCKEKIQLKDSDYDFWSKMNPSLVNRTQIGTGRRKMFEDFKLLERDDFWKKYRHTSIKKKSRYIAKKIVKKAGIETALRKRL